MCSTTQQFHPHGYSGFCGFPYKPDVLFLLPLSITHREQFWIHLCCLSPDLYQVSRKPESILFSVSLQGGPRVSSTVGLLPGKVGLHLRDKEEQLSCILIRLRHYLRFLFSNSKCVSLPFILSSVLSVPLAVLGVGLIHSSACHMPAVSSMPLSILHSGKG